MGGSQSQVKAALSSRASLDEGFQSFSVVQVEAAFFTQEPTDMSANAERAPLLAKRPAHRPQLSSLSQLSGGASYSAANRPNPSRRKRRPTADKGPEDSLSDAEKTRILIVIGIMRFTEPIRRVSQFQKTSLRQAASDLSNVLQLVGHIPYV